MDRFSRFQSKFSEQDNKEDDKDEKTDRFSRFQRRFSEQEKKEETKEKPISSWRTRVNKLMDDDAFSKTAKKDPFSKENIRRLNAVNPYDDPSASSSLFREKFNRFGPRVRQGGDSKDNEAFEAKSEVEKRRKLFGKTRSEGLFKLPDRGAVESGVSFDRKPSLDKNGNSIDEKDDIAKCDIKNYSNATSDPLSDCAFKSFLASPAVEIDSSPASTSDTVTGHELKASTSDIVTGHDLKASTSDTVTGHELKTSTSDIVTGNEIVCDNKVDASAVKSDPEKHKQTDPKFLAAFSLVDSALSKYKNTNSFSESERPEQHSSRKGNEQGEAATSVVSDDYNNEELSVPRNDVDTHGAPYDSTASFIQHSNAVITDAAKQIQDMAEENRIHKVEAEKTQEEIEEMEKQLAEKKAKQEAYNRLLNIDQIYIDIENIAVEEVSVALVESKMVEIKGHGILKSPQLSEEGQQLLAAAKESLQGHVVVDDHVFTISRDLVSHLSEADMQVLTVQADIISKARHQVDADRAREKAEADAKKKADNTRFGALKTEGFKTWPLVS